MMIAIGLTEKGKSEILGSNKLIGALADTLGRSTQTIESMVDRNDLLLTHPLALAVLRSESKLSDDEILISKEIAA
jgi:hypothetical protein